MHVLVVLMIETASFGKEYGVLLGSVAVRHTPNLLVRKIVFCNLVSFMVDLLYKPSRSR